MIGVKNCSGKKLVARFDGRDYTFEADEKVVTPLHEDAAHHIFGYGERDKSRALLRLGWIQNGGTLEQGLERLDEFQFLAAEDPKFKDPHGAETDMGMPMKLHEGDGQTGMALSPAEQELLNKPKGSAQKFAHEKK